MIKITILFAIFTALLASETGRNIEGDTSSPPPDQNGPGGDIFRDWFAESFFVNKTCAGVVTTTEPVCYAPRPYNDALDTGMWVCRTFYNPVTGVPKTFSACITEDRAFDTDTCGCCQAVCPAPCGMNCTLEDGETGVLIDASYKDRNVTRCIPPELAVSLVARDTIVSCTTAVGDNATISGGTYSTGASLAQVSASSASSMSIVGGMSAALLLFAAAVL